MHGRLPLPHDNQFPGVYIHPCNHRSNARMSTTSIHVTLPKALKGHIDQCVAEGEFLSPDDYIRALVRADRAHRLRREDLLSGDRRRSCRC